MAFFEQDAPAAAVEWYSMVPDDMQDHAGLPLHEGGMLAGERHESKNGASG
jgi:hypothetical protein